MSENKVPKSLRIWFVIHFILDIIFALPLMIIPELFLKFLGWEHVDPIATRLVAAALLGIGIESLIGYKAKAETFKNMLNLKIIWSITAVIGIGVSMIMGAQGSPISGWFLLSIFVLFNILWVFWRIRISKLILD